MKIFSKKTIILILALLAVLWWSKGHFYTTIANSNPTGSSIIVFGDSLASGFGAPEGKGYVSLLATEFNRTIINQGEPGDTTSSALKRFERDVLQQDPKVVIIELGGNDLLNKIPKSQTQRNLEIMITQSQKTGAAVVLVGVQAPFDIGGLGGVFKDLARQHQTGLVSNVLSGIMGKPNLMFDQIHPNAAGHQIMAERISKELRSALPNVFH